MTWADYHPIPGSTGRIRRLKPARGFRVALVARRLPRPAVRHHAAEEVGSVRQPPDRSRPPRRVPQFYADFWMKPGAAEPRPDDQRLLDGAIARQGRHPEDRRVRPLSHAQAHLGYGLNEWGQTDRAPGGSRADGRMEPDADKLWQAADGKEIREDYDIVLRIYAGYDETGVWQEFGEMKFASKDDIPAAWGNPDTTKPRWVATRYVPWTSWMAGPQQWGLSSVRQGENSGTITHEIAHFAFSIGDNNNNPYVEPYRRVAAGPWDIMDRGSFNGPGGPHRRWVIPPTQGASMPAGLMLRSRIKNEFIGEPTCSGSAGRPWPRRVAVAEVTARAVDPLPGTFAGIVVRLDGAAPEDRTPPDDPATNPLSAGVPDFNFYTLEVVQRIGYDSFTPDSGVLIAKNKDSLRGRNGGLNGFNSYIWVIDAHPEDINVVDYFKPDGTPVMRTIADYRQLNDALFHAGLDSGSQYEWEDTPNRLHFYVVGIRRDKDGILFYTLAVRSLDGAGAADARRSRQGAGGTVGRQGQGRARACLLRRDQYGRDTRRGGRRALRLGRL